MAKISLRSRCLEVVGEREKGSARGKQARGEGAPSPLACLLLSRAFFLVPTTSKRLLRRLGKNMPFLRREPPFPCEEGLTVNMTKLGSMFVVIHLP